MRSLSLITTSKKGQVNTIAPAVITLTIAAVFLILGLVIIQNIRDTDIVKQANSVQTYNETLTSVTEAGKTVAGASASGFNSFIVLSITNKTATTIIPTTNYTYTSAGVVKFTGANSIWNNTNWNITYTYRHGDMVYNDANETLVGLGTFADFWEIIILAVVISVVIGLLILAFGRYGAR